MNIVKFKDIMKEGDEIFNSLFRGKYCYCVHWRWCITLEENTPENYIEISKQEDPIPPIPEGVTYITLADYTDYIDMAATNKVNKVDSYLLSNSYIPSDYTLDQIKKFRTFVATALLVAEAEWDEEYDVTLTDKIEKMLQYYKNGMFDDIVKALMAFANSTSLNISGTYTDCGCGNTTTANSITKIANTAAGIYTNTAGGCGCSSANSALLLANACDCVSLYRNNIRAFMIDVFSDWKFWDLVSDTVVPDMINMLKAILDAGLPFNTLNTDVVFGDCSCMNQGSDDTGRLIVSNLIKALTYIKDEDVVAHKNFIKNSLYAWASKLYEYMEW